MSLRALLLSGVLALSTISGSAVAASQDLVRTDMGHIGTEVRLGGKGPYLFLVDTAAMTSAVYEHLREELGLTPEPGAQIELQGAGGTQQIDQYRLPPLEVAGVTATDLLTAGIPGGVKHGDAVMGVVGIDVLSHHTVEFDLKSDRIELHPAGTRPAGSEGWHEIPFKLLPEIGFIMLELNVGGKTVATVLDTGARRTFINWAAARQAGTTPDSPGLVKGSASGGATSHAYKYDTFEFNGLSLGAVTFPASSLAIGDISVFAALGLADKPGGIVGLDLMGDKRFAIDYKNLVLLIAP